MTQEQISTLKQIREAFQWTWDNMATPHTSDHFNVPANGIQAIDNLIEQAASPAAPVRGAGEMAEELWDKHSVYLETDIDLLQMYTGQSVLTQRSFTKLIEELTAQLPSAKDAGVLVQAMNDIQNPIEYLTRKAKEDGGILDGQGALMLIKSAELYKTIASNALTQYNNPT
jgi:hypothetical protein